MPWNEIEYNQISGDWRHRDNLTWQIPSIIALVGGILSGTAFALNLDPKYLWIIRLILIGFGAVLSILLTIALGQNLELQKINGKQLEEFSEKIGKKTQRVGFARTGSFLLYIFCVLISAFLTSMFFYLLSVYLASLWLERHYFLFGFIVVIIHASIQAIFIFCYKYERFKTRKEAEGKRNV